MYDILVYLFENCQQAELAYDRERVARSFRNVKLTVEVVATATPPSASAPLSARRFSHTYQKNAACVS